ncbi:MAG TPA: glycosyltransferase family 1 protein [Phycisphaerales bacterium]|nr:glycosyltransferase family 1 protein [Phycisphaerales bacterium]
MRLVLIASIPRTLFFYQGLIHELIAQGHDVRVLSSGHPELMDLQEMGCSVLAVNIPRRISPFTDLVTIVRMVRDLRQRRPHIVHAHTPKAGLVGMLASFLVGVPHRIYTLHGCPLETATGLKRRLLWLSDRVACILATHVLVVSSTLHERFQAEGLCPVEKMHMLGDGTACGIDVDHFHPTAETAALAQQIRQEHHIPADAVVFGYVGRLVPDKGIKPLVDGFLDLYAGANHLRLLIVGDLDTSRERLDAVTLGHVDNHPAIIHVSHVKDPVPYYAAMDVVILPSRREGFSYVLLEAAAMERPTITTRATGCLDAVVDGQTGLLVDVDNAEQLRRAMAQLSEDATRRRAMGLAGRERVCRSFSLRRLVEEHLRLYEELYLGKSRLHATRRTIGEGKSGPGSWDLENKA